MSAAASFVRGLQHSVWRVNRWMAMLAGWLVLVITAITCYGVFTRYVLNRPDTWSFPVSAYLLSFVVFFAVSHALQEGVHVRVDLIYEWFPGRAARWAGVVADVATLGFLWLFAMQAWRVYHEAYAQGRTDETTLAWQVAAVQWVMPLGAACLLVTHIVMVGGRFIGRQQESANAKR